MKVGKGVMMAGTDRCDAHAISSLKAFSLVNLILSSGESNFNQVDIFPTTHVDHLRPGNTISERVVGPLRDADTPISSFLNLESACKHLPIEQMSLDESTEGGTKEGTQGREVAGSRMVWIQSSLSTGTGSQRVL